MIGRRWIATALVAAAALGSAGSADAMNVGRAERIVPIQPTKSGKFNICYKTTTFWLVLGCYVEDDGYVLQKVDDTTNYFPRGPKFAQLAQAGDMPETLPPYSLSIYDYLMGYSLWIALGLIVGVGLLRWFVEKRRGSPTSEPLDAADPFADYTVEDEGDDRRKKPRR